MHLLTRTIVVAAALGSAPLGAHEAATAGDLPDWMAGAWIAETPDGGWTEEWWTPAKGGLMMGAGRSGKGDRVEWWEQTRIERSAGKIRFCALPKGQGGTCFAATKVSEADAVFENPAHDFPTRVAYRRDGSMLLAEVSGPNGSNPQRWRFRRLDQAVAPALSARTVRPLSPISAKPPVTAIRSGWEPAER